MPAPATVDDLLELMNKSGLVESEHLQSTVTQVSSGHPLSGPQDLADRLIEAGVLTRFQARQFMMGKWRGFYIGKYRVLEQVGRGGMGAVYLCEHQVLGKKVAIKVLPTNHATNPSALGRFYREARAAAGLEHPNLVRAHDIDQDGELHYLIMDYVDGVSLHAIVYRFGPLSIARATNYTSQAANGLAYAHDCGLIHRDVKPANILLERNGNVKVLDLGLARFTVDEDLLTVKYDERSVLGTADYLSPEQAINSHDVDHRTDIYSLGCTFYYMLTGHPPFPDGKVTQKLIWHQIREPSPVEKLRPEIPEALARIICKMMAKEPEHRYQSLVEVMDALSPWTAELIPPPSEEEMPRLSPAAQTHSRITPRSLSPQGTQFNNSSGLPRNRTPRSLGPARGIKEKAGPAERRKQVGGSSSGKRRQEGPEEHQGKGWRAPQPPGGCQGVTPARPVSPSEQTPSPASTLAASSYLASALLSLVPRCAGVARAIASLGGILAESGASPPRTSESGGDAASRTAQKDRKHGTDRRQHPSASTTAKGERKDGGTPPARQAPSAQSGPELTSTWQVIPGKERSEANPWKALLAYWWVVLVVGVGAGAGLLLRWLSG